MIGTDALTDPKSGYNPKTKIFSSVRLPIDLPSPKTPLSLTHYVFSLQSNSPWSNSVALINASNGQQLSYSELIKRVNNLTSHLQKVLKLSKNHVAFVLSPNSIHVPILYFSLLSLGVIVSPANPISTESEISRQIQLCKPVIAFATSSTVCKLPKLKHKTILLDSPEFELMMTSSTLQEEIQRVEVSQSDVAAILYSSGTTGKVKGVMLTHRNLIAVVGMSHSMREERESPAVFLYTVPYFHIFGFYYSAKSVALSEAVVVMERFDVKRMLRAVDKYRVTSITVAPPVVVAMTKSEVTDEFDLRSLETVGCGGAPLGKDVIAAFTERFPTVDLTQGYGLTETSGGVYRLLGPKEVCRWGSAGRLNGCCEAKIVDPDTGDALPPGKQGEIWLRGPSIMAGYVGDPEATSATLVADGWLRTGDLCFIDDEGFLYVVDRLKELIKYKGYQVAPAELEQLLQSHPEVADAAVIPYPDEEAGQVPMAFVVRKHQSNIGERDIMDFVSKQVAPYKKIRRVAFVSSIPKSAAGKILRKDLRQMVQSIIASRL